VQLLLDYEYTRGLSFLAQPRITREELGLESIFQVGFGRDQDFLTTEHTIEHMRAATWMPNCFTRNAWSPEENARVLRQTAARVQELMGRYEKPTGREEQVAAARAVVARAQRELGSG